VELRYGLRCGGAAGLLEGPANIVMVLADGGWKYLSAGLWDTPEDELAERMEQGIWW